MKVFGCCSIKLRFDRTPDAANWFQHLKGAEEMTIDATDAVSNVVPKAHWFCKVTIARPTVLVRLNHIHVLVSVKTWVFTNVFTYTISTIFFMLFNYCPNV